MGFPDGNGAVAQDFSAQASVPLEKLFRARREGVIQPVAWSAMARPTKTNSLNFELFANQFVQIDARDDDIAAQHARWLILDFKVLGKFLENFSGEKSDLAFVALPVIVKPVAANSVAGDAFDPLHLDQGVIVRRLPVVSEVVVPG